MAEVNLIQAVLNGLFTSIGSTFGAYLVGRQLLERFDGRKKEERGKDK